MILADDLGYAEITCDGKQPIPTPRVASIARHGVCCPAGYVSCPVCSPTRAGLMTGRYQQRFGHEFNPGPAALANKNFGLPLQERTLADRLKKVGYATGLVGKWHLGYESPYHPLRRGFDEFFGFLGGATRTSTARPTRPIRSGAASSRSTSRRISPTRSAARQWRSSIGTRPSRSSSTWPSTPCTRRCRPRPSTASGSATFRIRGGGRFRRCSRRWTTAWGCCSTSWPPRSSKATR